jgi:hypothetical protein
MSGSTPLVPKGSLVVALSSLVVGTSALVEPSLAPPLPGAPVELDSPALVTSFTVVIPVDVLLDDSISTGAQALTEIASIKCSIRGCIVNAPSRT